MLDLHLRRVYYSCMLYSLAPNGEWRINKIVHQSTGGKGVALCCGALRRGGVVCSCMPPDTGVRLTGAITAHHQKIEVHTCQQRIDVAGNGVSSAQA